MKKRKEPAFTIAFLDVLSNALAAVLILAIVRLQPDTAGDPVAGSYYISVTSLDKTKQDSTLVIAIKFKDFPKLVHEPSEYIQTKARMNYSGKVSARVNFLKQPQLQDFEEIIVYNIDPDFNDPEGEKIFVEVVFPNMERIIEQVILRQENDFRFQLFKDDIFKAFTHENTNIPDN